MFHNINAVALIWNWHCEFFYYYLFICLYNSWHSPMREYKAIKYIAHLTQSE